MKQFIGTKRVLATPMNRREYCKYMNWTPIPREDGEDEGYLVEYLDSSNLNHPNHKGYISWSPKEQFDNAYREINMMTFGEAIEALKKGLRVARAGWNGKNMFLFLLPAGTVPTKAIHDPALRAVIEEQVGGETFEALGSIRMFTADKKILTGWLASQTDMLAEDWALVL
jgi:hypothetical protein